MGNTALIVIDMMNNFCHPDGPLYREQHRDILPDLCEVIERSREAGLTIIHINSLHREGKPNKAEITMKPSDSGAWGREFDASIRVEPSDYIVSKRCYSSFYCTDLDMVLADNDIANVVITGVKTNCCVRATVTDASYRNLNVYVIGDCVATQDPDVQRVHLQDIHRYMGTVLSKEEYFEMLENKSFPGRLEFKKWTPPVETN